MRTKKIIANWKMNKTLKEVDNFLIDYKKLISDQKASIENVICPPFVYLQKLTKETIDEIKIGAQDVSANTNGAYTGEISASMLASLEIKYCIVGHSERRKYHNETSEIIKLKLKNLLEFNLSPIFCCGEDLTQREANNHFEIVKKQINEALFSFSEKEISRITIAYEPVWAIGTGVNASAKQAQEMHSYIRGLLNEEYNNDLSENISILYGGSCNSNNAKDLAICPDVDGALVGGASLLADEFFKIISIFNEG